MSENKKSNNNNNRHDIIAKNGTSNANINGASNSNINAASPYITGSHNYSNNSGDDYEGDDSQKKSKKRSK